MEEPSETYNLTEKEIAKDISAETTTALANEIVITPTAATAGPSLTVDQARNRLEEKVETINTVSSNEEKDALLFDSIQLVLQDHDALKDKVGKLKSLLGRSAKAQRESKVELDATQKKLDHAVQEIERLQRKIEKLSNRPTHMELLADFEANFDRALLSVGHPQSQHHQAGGEDTSPATEVLSGPPVMDQLLVQELNETKERREKLEKLNANLVQRNSQLEHELSTQVANAKQLAQKVSQLDLEKRMAEMESSDAAKQLQQKSAELSEMQLELDLVTQSSVRANAKAAVGEEMLQQHKAEKHQIQQLEAKVQALQEWALASSEAKTLAQERVRVLEQQLKALQRSPENFGIGDDKVVERQLVSDTGSFVLGAGDVGRRVFSLTPEQVKSIRLSERVVLKWHFDLTSPTAGLSFSIMRGSCDSATSRMTADCIIKNRWVTGGAEGEVEDAFTSQRACTLEWSNYASWITPKTVKYQVVAVVVEDE